jgi:apolipoprotein N-acyltransferase
MKTPKLLLQAPLLLLPLLSGILMGLTPAPVNAWPLAWIAIAPLWFLIVNGTRLRQCALYGLVWGIGYHGLALSWITGIHPMTWMGVPWLASIAIALFCWTFITLWGAGLVAIWASSLFWLNRHHNSPWIRILMGTALWCGLESFWSGGSLWWSSLSYTQSPHNLAILHLGQISGPSTVTAAIVAVNGLIAEAFISYRELQVGSFREQPSSKTKLKPVTLMCTAVGLLMTLHLIGFSLYSKPLIQPQATALKVGIIQGNIGNTVKLFTEGKRRALENYTKGYLTLANQKVDAVLTPEGALPFYLNDSRLQPLFSAILDKGVVAWIGAFGQKGRGYTNSLFTVTGTGETFSRYDKVKLVPLGEYVPFEEVLGGLVDRLSPLKEHQMHGSPNQIFDTPFGRAIVGICYDSAFSEHFRRQAAAKTNNLPISSLLLGGIEGGGQFILTASNNAHYNPAMPAQHHAQDVMRAIETDRWAIRATNTGYSGIVNPHGQTIWLSGINTFETHADTIYRRQTQTFYVRWGDWLTPVLLGCAGLSWFVFNRRFGNR